MGIKFLHNEPVAVLGEWVVISDLHIGSPFSPNWKVIAEVVERLMQREKKRRLLILGDVKDRVAGTDANVGRFIREIGSKYDLHICKGNHDGNIEKYEAYCTVYGPGGAIINGIGCTHGHAWPDKELLKCKTILAGHYHPKHILGGEFKTAVKVWVMGRLSRDRLRAHYGKETRIAKNINIIIFPSFSESYSTNVRENAPGPFMHTFIKKSAKIYLLNGIQIK